MKQSFSIFFAFALLIFFAFSGCNTHAPVQKEGTVFYFFPKENIYYDADNDQYFLQQKDSGWQTVSALPEGKKDSLGEKVLLTDTIRPVWKNNAQDKLLYSLKAYTSADDYQKKFYEDSINSLPKKIETIQQDTVVKKEKTGLGKFFEKVFSKKDKKAKEGNLR